MLKQKVSALVILISILISATFFVGGFLWGYSFGKNTPRTLVIYSMRGLNIGQPQTIDFSVFWQAWKLLEDNYLKNKDVSNQTRTYGAISGLTASFGDPHTMFFKPDDNKKFQQDIEGEFGGIGAELDIRKNQIIVVAPLKNTPASAAGIMPGDKILKINATSTEGMTIENAIGLIRGPEGTDVTLTIGRDNWDKPKEIKITRAKITVPTIEYKIKDDNIVHLQVHSFNSNTNQLLYEAATEFLPKKIKGIILDLRSNPGGYLDVAVDLAGWFLPKDKLVVSEAGREDTKEEFKSQGNGAFKDLPVVILINKGSASASEILAGALRDNRKIKLIGEQSFGKGTVQKLFLLRDGSSIKITNAQWVLPSGNILEGKGLEPDVKVEMTEQDITDKKDPQLDKAMEVLNQIANSH